MPSIQHARVLELGCGDGANLIPMAYYRPETEFIGVDGCARHIGIANARLQKLNLNNLTFLQYDFRHLEAQLDGYFDFIIVHGVFSWVPDAVRDALFQLCSDRLSTNGLLYLNYNTKPGWNVRGMVRDYLLAHTQHLANLPEKISEARRAAINMARSLIQEPHPFSQLLANEFQFVCDNHDSYIAHEFLAEHNNAYWRSEFLVLAASFGFHHIGDADYNYPSGRIPPSLPKQLESQNLIGNNLNDTVDLISYRQLHTPIFAQKPTDISKPPTLSLDNILIASCLSPVGPHKPRWYQHPNGYQVEAKEDEIARALDRLSSLWPNCIPLESIFNNHSHFTEDLILLHQNGLIELRLPESPNQKHSEALNRLNQLERHWGGYYTTAQHQRVDNSQITLHLEHA